ncbi:MAG: amidase family protein [Acidimicrobiales bacterium]
MSELVDLSAVEQRRMISAKEVSAVELLDAHLARIDAVNPALNAIVGLRPEIGRAQAQAVDQKTASGEDPGPLAGLVTAYKDLNETKDFLSTDGIAAQAGRFAPADSLMVQRMTAAGVVAVGKTNVPELGAGSHTINPVYGTTVNPYDTTRSAGGSSGGAGVALRCGMVAVADGSDMGGSLRNPAGWNNVVGLRPSPGVVPSIGPGNAWATWGTGGPMGRTVDDLYLLMKVIAQPDVRDPATHPIDLPDQLPRLDRPLRVAFSPGMGGLPVEADVAGVVAAAVEGFADLGWSVEEAEPDFTGADECFESIRSWLFASGPGVGLGERITTVKETVQDEVRRGMAMSAMDIASAIGMQKKLWDRAVAFMSHYDLLVGPVSQLSPFDASIEYPTEVAGQPMGRYIEWMRSVCRVTTLGLPALSVPAGFTDAGLPVGLQMIGQPWGDVPLLAAAKAVEDLMPWHQRGPALPS